MLCICLAGFEVRADVDSEPGYWGVITATGTGDRLTPKLDKWRWWLEGQIRFLGDDPDFNQGLVRPGIGYAVTPGLTVWAGYGWFRTSPPSGSDFDESRIWQQLSWSRAFDQVRFATRTRLEQRFVEGSNDTGLRFRQRVELAYPSTSRVYATVNDEVFVNLNDTDYGALAGFDQNRFFVGPGWAVDEDRHVRIEAGYLNQYIDRPNRNDAMNHILVMLLQLRY